MDVRFPSTLFWTCNVILFSHVEPEVMTNLPEIIAETFQLRGSSYTANSSKMDQYVHQYIDMTCLYADRPAFAVEFTSFTPYNQSIYDYSICLLQYDNMPQQKFYDIAAFVRTHLCWIHRSAILCFFSSEWDNVLQKDAQTNPDVTAAGSVADFGFHYLLNIPILKDVLSYIHNVYEEHFDV